jgi:hypothetical protein
VLFAMMPLWHSTGKQNPSFETYRTTAQAFHQKVEADIAERKVGEEKGIAVVAARPGEDVSMAGRLWAWYPVLRLKKGETYRLHLSSRTRPPSAPAPIRPPGLRGALGLCGAWRVILWLGPLLVIPIAPGRHAVSVRLADARIAETGVPEHTLSQEIASAGGRAPLLEYVPDAGWRLHP